MIAAIEWDALLELLWAAPLAGLGVSLSFSFVILGIARATDARRDGASGTAGAFGALAVISGLAFVAAVAYGFSIILE